MSAPRVNDSVRLVRDVPQLLLRRGELGVVRSVWFSPDAAYEVEFHQVGCDLDTRALLSADQVEVEAADAVPAAAY